MIRILPHRSRAFSVLLLLLLLVSACNTAPERESVGNNAGKAESGAVSGMENTKAGATPKVAAAEVINAAAAGREAQPAFVHRAGSGNISGNSTYMDDPTINGDPDAQILITRNWNPGGEGGTYNDHPVGVWYDSGAERWAIYNEDREAMPDGAAFNVTVVPDPDRTIHRAVPGNTAGNSTYLDLPSANGDPDAELLVTRNRNPGGEGGTYNDHPVGVWYDSGAERWAIYNEDREAMPDGAAFNVAISKADRMSSEEVASRDTGEVAKSNAGTGEKPADGTETDDLPEGIPEYQDFYAGGNPETPADLISGNSSVGTIPPVKPFNFGRDPGGPDDKTLYLTIPALDMEGIPVFDTLSEEKLRDGTVHIPATGYPWQDGANVFIAGHRIGYPNTLSYYVFYRLDQLAQGDEILLQDSSGREFEYRVTEQKVVGPENVDVMNAVEDRSIISLQTCTLPDYEERLIVRGELVKKNT